MTTQLHHYFSEAVRSYPNRVAVTDVRRAVTYAQLESMVRRATHHLEHAGVTAGDRVALWLEKSAWALAVMQAALRLGAIYIPIDPRFPPRRVLEVLGQAKPRVLVSSREQRRLLDASLDVPTIVDETLEASSLETDLPTRDFGPHHPAYILFTSGSTGRPKGVCISHRNVCSFVDWATATLRLSCEDRLANHAPLHFDLSVLDVYGSFASGASVHLIPEVMSYVPSSIVDFIRRNEISVLYIVPSILSLLVDNRLLEQNALRCLVFAGEPFAIHDLRKVRTAWPRTRLLNFYGPTETNVCTYFEVGEVDPERIEPVPIGGPAAGDEVFAIVDGRIARPGEQGELVVRGPTVMLGYWGDDLQTDRTYQTGDFVEVLRDGTFHYIGRRDHMVKIRGQRVELSEIEAVLSQWPTVRRCAVVIVGTGSAAKLHAFVVFDGAAPSTLELRRHCAERLPPAWTIDRVHAIDALPLTSNGKIDRRALQDRAGFAKEART